MAEVEEEDVDEESFGASQLRDGDRGGEKEEQRTVHRFKDRVSGKEYDLVIDDYIEDHNYDKIPHIHGSSRLDQIEVFHWRFTITPHRRMILRNLADAFTVISSCFLTFSISNHEPFLSAVISQAVVITMVLVAFPELSAASAVGAFAGMASSAAVIDYGWLCLLSIIVSIVWFIYNYYELLVGFGGRIGTCVFASMNIFSLIAMASGAVPWSLYGDAKVLWSQQLDSTAAILCVVAATLLSGISGAIRLHCGVPLNPIQVPTLLVLSSMLILEPATASQLKQIGNGLATGSFVAMASTQHLPTILDFGGAGFVAGLFVLLIDPFFNGFGGKDGFAAFGGFTTYMVLSKLASRFYLRSHQTTASEGSR
jgi:hypothetical protein